jgi:hypothetical protein
VARAYVRNNGTDAISDLASATESSDVADAASDDPPMKFKLDENLPGEGVQILRDLSGV